jgi:hypothetical protein
MPGIYNPSINRKLIGKLINILAKWFGIGVLIRFGFSFAEWIMSI